MSDDKWWEWKDPRGWTKDDLADLAMRGKDIWNDVIELWPGERIDLSWLTFEDDFDGYVFKKSVDFEGATFKRPFFRGSVFGDPKNLEDEAPRSHFRFNNAVFEGAVLFDNVEVYNGSFYFRKSKMQNVREFLFKVLPDRRGVMSSVRYLGIYDVNLAEADISILNVIGFKCSISLGKIQVKKSNKFSIINEAPNCEGLVSSLSISYCTLEETYCYVRGCYKSLIFDRNKTKQTTCTFENIRMKTGNFDISSNRCVDSAFILHDLNLTTSKINLNHNVFGLGVQITKSKFRLERNQETKPDSNIIFSDNKIEGKRFFIQESHFCGHVDFSGSVFDSAFGFDDVTFDVLPDLRLTKVGSHFSSEGMTVIGDDFEGDKNLSDKYRRFKELAIAARDHDRELEYFAKEMLAKMLSESSFWKKFSISLYGKTSDFGCSIEKPLHGLVRTILFTGIVLFFMAPYSDCLSDWDRFLNVLKLTLQNIVPFLPISKIGFEDAYETLFPEGHFGADIVLGIEGLLGFIFLFLIGLALRNRFRL